MVAMMREFFVGVNTLRDQARAALPPDERALLFGDGATETGYLPDNARSLEPAAMAVRETEAAHDGLPPVAPRA